MKLFWICVGTTQWRQVKKLVQFRRNRTSEQYSAWPSPSSPQEKWNQKRWGERDWQKKHWKRRSVTERRSAEGSGWILEGGAELLRLLVIEREERREKGEEELTGSEQRLDSGWLATGRCYLWRCLLVLLFTQMFTLNLGERVKSCQRDDNIYWEKNLSL